jgi:hypothetical protein
MALVEMSCRLKTQVSCPSSRVMEFIASRRPRASLYLPRPILTRLTSKNATTSVMNLCPCGESTTLNLSYRLSSEWRSIMTSTFKMQYGRTFGQTASYNDNHDCWRTNVSKIVWGLKTSIIERERKEEKRTPRHLCHDTPVALSVIRHCITTFQSL